MLKKLFAAVFILIFLSGIAFFLYYFSDTKKPPENSAVRAIPTTAAFIFEAKKSHDSWKKISETNIIWEELLNIKFAGRLDSAIKNLDSIYEENFLVREIFDKQSLFISAHISDGVRPVNTIALPDFLFLFNVPPAIGRETINEIALIISDGNSSNQKEYDGALIYSLHPQPQTETSSANTVLNRTFSYTIYQDIFIGSFNTMLIEDAIRQLNSGISLKENFAFNKVKSTSGENADLNLYINPSFFPSLIESFIKKEYSSSIAPLKNFSDWTALDLKIKANILMLNGFSFSNDTITKFLNFFKHQKAQEPEFTGIIPSNTAAFVHFGFSNFKAFYKEFNVFIDHNERREKINSINKECKCDIEKEALSWIENEMALVITKPPSNTTKETEEPSLPSDCFFALFKSNNITEAKRSLSLLHDSTFETITDTTYGKHHIHKIKYEGIHPLLLGNLFSTIREGYYLLIDDYIIFGNEITALRDIISFYYAEKTLSKNLNFAAFSDNLPSESNLFFYSNIDYSFNLISHFASKDFLKKLEENKETIRKFEAFAILLSGENDQLFYTTAFLKYNPVNKREISTIWETRLDSTVHSQPVLLTNHYTGEKEVYVQDDSNIIYLLSATGKILWKRQLPEKILSRIYQVDALKNNKLQMLFNTQSHIYLIDRNGKDVAGFPVRLKASATNEISVFDYDKNKNYRILIACEDSRVYNYEISGQAVKGWEFPLMRNVMKKPLEFFSSEGKDFIAGIDVAGNIYLVDRMGKRRMNLKGKIPVSEKNNFFIEPGKNISKTRIVATDSTGNIVRLYLNGNIENIKIDEFSPTHFFAYLDINNDKSCDYIFADKNKLKVYSQDQLRYSIFDFHFDSPITQKPIFFELPDKTIKIGICDKESSKVYLFDAAGALAEDFPLLGTTLFSIGDLNDGELYLVTGNGSNIYSYLLK